MKVLIIGSDDATWNVFDNYTLQNYMPNLNELKNNGYCELLRSTDPPITSVAWTTHIVETNKRTGVL